MDGNSVDTKAEIDQLVVSFFELFSNRGGARPELGKIFELFVPQGVIAKCTGRDPEISALQEFITPRQALLTNGRLTDFFEVELAEITRIFGHVAQRVSIYEKSGCLDGITFSTRGMKTFQFLETPGGWRIFSVAWDDERDGFSVPQSP